MDFQLTHEIGAVCFDCLNSDPERRSDLLAALAFSEQLNDFSLAFSEALADQVRNLFYRLTRIETAKNHLCDSGSKERLSDSQEFRQR